MHSVLKKPATNGPAAAAKRHPKDGKSRRRKPGPLNLSEPTPSAVTPAMTRDPLLELRQAMDAVPDDEIERADLTLRSTQDAFRAACGELTRQVAKLPPRDGRAFVCLFSEELNAVLFQFGLCAKGAVCRQKLRTARTLGQIRATRLEFKEALRSVS